ncbi:hypothetical protein [Massilia pseudoviolaceinigra]|uniref:hypothetical protein n=1 Tax=Massilia pseudoviolaceinigra TaxID=3057165 RepID=UPI0027964F7D|nr:hypothetical protein [Massilia sp. CCM 9206]MDQ1921301.1 hypothetical protein [Massilia sp. CCM 9206]
MKLLHHLRIFARPASPAVFRWTCTLVLILVLLTACAAAPVVQEVKVPVYRSCVAAAPERPAFAVRGLAPDASDGEKVLALARDLPVHLKYEAQLEAVIAGCL